MVLFVGLNKLSIMVRSPFHYNIATPNYCEEGRRIVTVIKGKNPGKTFEEDFISSFPIDMFTYKLRDSAGAWEGVAKGKGKIRFTPSNVCDFVAHNYYKGETLLMELKSTQAKSMSFTNLKKNQVIGL